MKFTIATVTLNAAQVVEKTIQSVISQDFDDYEYIIIDGQSTDGTLSIIKEYSNDIDIIISEPDKGIYDGMNKAIYSAHGEYLLFMNAGDVFVDNNVLSHVSRSIDKSHPTVVYGDVIRQYTIGRRLVKAAKLSQLKTDMAFSHQSTFIQVVAMKEMPFRTEYRFAADYAMILGFYLKRVCFLYTNFPISIVEADGGATFNHFLSSRREALDIQLAVGCNPLLSRVYFAYVVTKLYTLRCIKSFYYKIRQK